MKHNSGNSFHIIVNKKRRDESRGNFSSAVFSAFGRVFPHFVVSSVEAPNWGSCHESLVVTSCGRTQVLKVHLHRLASL